MPYLNGHTPNYGQRLIPNIIDEVSGNEPRKVFASIPVSGDLSNGYIDVTYHAVANAINRASWWLSESLGLANTSEVFSYMGPNDLRYPILLVAAIKCGYQMMMPSPRNSKEYHVELLRRSNSKTLLCARSHTRHIQELQDEDSLDLFFAVVPELSEILEETEVAPYPFEKSYSEIRKNKFMILHTSGSTGPPRPISFSIESTTTEDAHQSLEDPSHRLWWRLFANRRYFLGMPCFHSAGIWCALFMPVYFGSTVVYGPSKRPLTSDAATAAMTSGRISGGFYPPSILEDLSKSPASLEKIRELDFIAYGGGPLSKLAGDTLSRITTLHNFIGFTEASAPPRYVMDPEDWNYFEFHPASGFVAKHHYDDLYVMTFERNPKYESIQSCFRLFPDLTEYSPGDLISKHPKKENLWTHRGRIDDLVVLSNGEKFNPIPIEETLRLCHFVKDVIVSGEGRFQASVLIEKDAETALNISDAEIIEALWPFVEKANKRSSAQSRITRSLIFVAPPEKPFSRSAKGTLQRRATLRNFETELDELYGGSGAGLARQQTTKSPLAVPVKADQDNNFVATRQEPPPREPKPTSALVHHVADSTSDKILSVSVIRELVTAVCNIRPSSDKDDLFELGIDSLQASEVAAKLKETSGLWPQDRDSAIRLLYANPSIQGIANAIQLRFDREGHPKLRPAAQWAAVDQSDAAPQGDDGVEELVEKYTADLEFLPNRAKTVVLTGATGSLGCYLLESLMNDPSISRIICLHRGQNGKEKQEIASRKRGLPLNPRQKSVEFFQMNLSRRDLGLEPTNLSDIQANADAIIHNAWDVDFNKHLTSFETHIAGVRHLAELAATSQRRARLIFVSSIASVFNWDASLGEVPEQVHTNHSVAGNSGYSQSKHTAENILQKFAASADLAASIVRVGQIAGPVSSPGVWSASDWLPMLVKTSKSLGVLPKSLGTGDEVDWVPIDVVAKVFMEVLDHELHSNHERQCSVYHIANPHKTSWGALLPATCHVLGSDVGLVPFHEWVHKLQERASANYDIQKFPALKILPFYQAMDAVSEARTPVLDTTRTLKVSKALANVDAVQGAWMEHWIAAWNVHTS